MSSSFSSELTVPPPPPPNPGVRGTELELLWEQRCTLPVHTLFLSMMYLPLAGLRLAALMGTDLFIPRLGLQASKDKPPQEKGAEAFPPCHILQLIVFLVFPLQLLS